MIFDKAGYNEKIAQAVVYGLDPKERHVITAKKGVAPSDYGEYDYQSICDIRDGRVRLGRWYEKPTDPPPPTAEEWLPIFRNNCEAVKPRDWAGRPHQDRIYAKAKKDFTQWVKSLDKFPGKWRVLRDLPKLLRREIEEDPSGELGLFPADEPTGYDPIFVQRIVGCENEQVSITIYGPDGKKSHEHWYRVDRPNRWESRRFSRAEVLEMAEGFHRYGEEPEVEPEPEIEDSPVWEWSATPSLVGGTLAAALSPTLAVYADSVQLPATPSTLAIFDRPDFEMVGFLAQLGMDHIARGPPVFAVPASAL